jgi:hypothetical protein
MVGNKSGPQKPDLSNWTRSGDTDSSTLNGFFQRYAPNRAARNSAAALRALGNAAVNHPLGLALVSRYQSRWDPDPGRQLRPIHSVPIGASNQ